jgi:hypothetical protein
MSGWQLLQFRKVDGEKEGGKKRRCSWVPRASSHIPFCHHISNFGGRYADPFQANQLANEETIEAIIRKRTLDGLSQHDQDRLLADDNSVQVPLSLLFAYSI